MNGFRFDPAPWLPAHDKATLDYVRAIRRDEMEYTNANGYSVKVVIDHCRRYCEPLFTKGELTLLLIDDKGCIYA